ncbi:MAG: FAD-dependent oxidoreductase [Nocardiopsaceae bacterium]|jgi:2-polyprenyl-6-methoxyphenol hydroxylase-like FAD-dependent oxidoreductase|nr:FAD-dependent oxidoreductase [Nocardiopsaceae bacterium]
MASELQTDCCVVGCGPAGAMLGLMLARQGVNVTVLEKHDDFLRDFRGDDISPATIEVLDELGLARDFLALNPKRIQAVEAHTPGGTIVLADLRRVRTSFPFFAVIPQWDFLDFVTREASREPNFRLLLGTQATELIADRNRTQGVRCRSGAAEFEVRAHLTVGADGRFSRVREHARLPLVVTAAPIDLLWFRLPKTRQAAQDAISIHLGGGHAMARIDRGSYWQVACMLTKGSAKEVEQAGITAFRDTAARCMPDLARAIAELRSWDQLSVLSVQTNRLRRWYGPGLMCIGDAAHAMSPIGGAGINLAIGDAVALASRLAAPLQRGEVPVRALAAVQRERAWQVHFMQSLQAPLTKAYLLAADSDPGRLTSFVQRAAPKLANLPGSLGLRSRVTALGLRKAHVAAAARRYPAPTVSPGDQRTVMRQASPGTSSPMTGSPGISPASSNPPEV